MFIFRMKQWQSTDHLNPAEHYMCNDNSNNTYPRIGINMTSKLPYHKLYEILEKDIWNYEMHIVEFSHSDYLNTTQIVVTEILR